jgi:hypothetical protein
MRSSILAFLALGGLLSTALAGPIVAAAGRQAAKEEDVISLSRADSPTELANRIHRLFSASQAREVDRLITAPDRAIAIAAGWERVRRTIPEGQQQQPLSPDGQTISRFLGLLEGRIQAPIPPAWEAVVKSARGRGRGTISFPNSKALEELLRSRAPVRRAGDRWVLEVDGKRISLPAGVESGPVDNAATLAADGTTYVGLYGAFPLPYRLFAIDRESGKALWSSEVWAAGGLMNYVGNSWHAAMICSEGETLAVFGVSGGEVYVEVFDKKTGQNRCRFGTAYFDAISPRQE